VENWQSAVGAMVGWGTGTWTALDNPQAGFVFAWGDGFVEGWGARDSIVLGNPQESEEAAVGDGVLLFWRLSVGGSARA